MATRANNREQVLLDEAARLFRQKGYEATSVRDIVLRLGMQPSSLYYHFASKEDILVSVYERGIAEITVAVEAATEQHGEPWARLEAACAAHLEALLESSDYPQVVIRILPDDVAEAASRMVALRDRYEQIFARLIGDLKLAKGVNRRYFRLVLLSALNTTQSWYKKNGEPPKKIARQILHLLRFPADHSH